MNATLNSNWQKQAIKSKRASKSKQSKGKRHRYKEQAPSTLILSSSTRSYCNAKQTTTPRELKAVSPKKKEGKQQ
jgi:hypothetical protein